MAETMKFNGFFKGDTVLAPGERMLLDFSFIAGGCFGCLKWLCCSGNVRKTFKNMGHMQQGVEVQVFDARKLEREQELSKREFFEKFGFVLLEHHSAMTAEDWLKNSSAPVPDTAALAKLADKVAKEQQCPVREIYAKELDVLVRELIPSTGDVYYPPFALRRGPGGPNNFYGTGVHQDYGLYPEDMVNTSFGDSLDRADNYAKWKAKMETGDFSGYCVINFWRPVPPMRGPVRNTPLAVCDPSTVRLEDVVPQDLYGFVPGGQHNMGLKFHKDQKWYYYPDMTLNEVLVFRQFMWEKQVPAPYDSLKTVFHTAFNHPGAPKFSEARTSSEYRIGVWMK